MRTEAKEKRAHARLRTLIAIALALLLAACDTGSPGRDRSDASGGEFTINIGRLICGGHLSLAVVEKKFQRRLIGFKLNTVQNQDWNAVVADMKSGDLAGSFMLSPLAMNLIREGFPGKIILTADRDGNGFVLSKKIRTIDDLKNWRTIIAVPHLYSQHRVLLHMVLQQHGIPEDRVTVLAMPPRDMFNALNNGEIDGFVVGEPEANKSIHRGAGWMAAISPNIWQDHMDHVFMATDAFIQEHPDLLQQLVTQLVQAGAYIETHPREVATWAETYTGSDAKYFTEVLTTPPDWIRFDDMRIEVADLRQMAEKMVDIGLWPDVPKDLATRYLDARFWQASANLDTVRQ